MRKGFTIICLVLVFFGAESLGQTQKGELAFSFETTYFVNLDQEMGFFSCLSPEGKIYVPLSRHLWITGGFGFWKKEFTEGRWSYGGDISNIYYNLGFEKEMPGSRSSSYLFKGGVFLSRIRENKLNQQIIPGIELGLVYRTSAQEPISLDFIAEFIVPLKRYIGVDLNVTNDWDNRAGDEMGIMTGGLKVGVRVIFKLRNPGNW